MYTHVEITHDITLQEGIIGCIIAAAYANGHPSPEDYDRMIDVIAGRELFLDTDIMKLIRNQMALRYVLEDETFLKISCEKVADEWKLPVFSMACHLILDSRLSPKAMRFLRAIKNELQLENVKEIVEVMQWLHKDKHRITINNI